MVKITWNVADVILSFCDFLIIDKYVPQSALCCCLVLHLKFFRSLNGNDTCYRRNCQFKVSEIVRENNELRTA